MIKFRGEEIVFDKFPNGETLFKKPDWEGIWITDKTHIQFKYTGDESLINLLFFKKYFDSQLKYYGANTSIILHMYYMPYSRMDRSEKGSPFTLQYISDFINDLSFDQVHLYEPHSNVTPALIKNSKVVDLNEDVLALKVIREIEDNENELIMFYPDNGASKRYENLKYPSIEGYKKRDFDSGKILSLDVIGDVPEKPFNVLIIDDLSSRGGTFYHSAKKLKELGANKIYLLVAHCEDTIFDGELFKTDYIEKIFTTDTHLTKHNDWAQQIHKDKLKVYSISEIISLMNTKGELH